ncbi:MAG: FAD-dependent oxidoreductase, partial [Victivallales bacterium]|nr:FAD-dependent oxidoreductase [Victivallales bacterium]
KYGAESLPPGWGDESGTRIGRYMTVFSPAAFTLALEELLEDSGVDVWYDTIVIDSLMSEKRLDAIEVVNKSGRGILRAKAFIDATGDADIANFAGCELREGLNHMSIWAIQASMLKAEAAVKFDDPTLLLDVVRMGADDSGNGHPESEKTWSGINGKNVSEFVIASRSLLRTRYANLAENTTDATTSQKEFPLTLPTTPQFRKTRMIVGEGTVSEMLDSTQETERANLVPDWRKPGRLWSVPDAALRPKNILGLYVAGRIISAGDDDAWNAVRVIPVAAFTGERSAILATT